VTEHEAVASRITRISHYIDHKQWTELRALFAPEIAVDYTALSGGAPQRQSPEALVGGWEKNLAPVTTQHLLGAIDVEIDGDRAKATCHVRANHFVKGKPGGEEWVVMGQYVFGLTKTEAWRIAAMKLEVFRQTGNAKLLAG
jgi:hypothetical protein